MEKKEKKILVNNKLYTVPEEMYQAWIGMIRNERNRALRLHECGAGMNHFRCRGDCSNHCPYYRKGKREALEDERTIPAASDNWMNELISEDTVSRIADLADKAVLNGGQLVRLLALGYKRSEICWILGIGNTTISYMLKKIRESGLLHREDLF